MSGTLYLVGTPIGNLGDLSVRALETLRSADFIAAEDTRVTAKLLNHFEIKKPCVSYYEHNKYASGEKIVARLLTGETCALVTDAGMPAISDPGEDIVRQCAEQGIDVQVIPGPCAAIAALAVSGLPTQQFCFEGFLAVSGKTRREHLDRLRGETRPAQHVRRRAGDHARARADKAPRAEAAHDARRRGGLLYRDAAEGRGRARAARRTRALGAGRHGRAGPRDRGALPQRGPRAQGGVQARRGGHRLRQK